MEVDSTKIPILIFAHSFHMNLPDLQTLDACLSSSVAILYYLLSPAEDYLNILCYIEHGVVIIFMGFG